ncbi:MAG: hypothetical protein G8D58_05965 [gamma proteobacterium symbiont of Phacoides pectinatus]
MRHGTILLLALSLLGATPSPRAGEINIYTQVCRYLVKDFGTSQSPKSTRQRDSRYCPDRPALITTPSRTLQQSCSCATPS